MELDIFDAFRAAGVPDDKARGAVGAITDLVDRRYMLHAEQLATRSDVANLRAEMVAEIGSLRVQIAKEIGGVTTEIGGLRAEMAKEIGGVRTEIATVKGELIRWCVGSMFASVGMFAGITRLLAH